MNSLHSQLSSPQAPKMADNDSCKVSKWQKKIQRLYDTLPPVDPNWSSEASSSAVMTTPLEIRTMAEGKICPK